MLQIGFRQFSDRFQEGFMHVSHRLQAEPIGSAFLQTWKPTALINLQTYIIYMKSREIWIEIPIE